MRKKIYDILKISFFILILVVIILDNFFNFSISKSVNILFSKTSRQKREKIKRDEKRIADLHLIQDALEKYIKDNGKPPKTGDYNEINSWQDFDTSTEGKFMTFLAPKYLKQIPVDPLNIGQKPVQHGYFYYYYTGNSQYGEKEKEKYFYILGTFLESGQSKAFLNHEVGYYLGRIIK